MWINQPKKGSSLVWANDLIRQLNLSGVLSRDSVKIMSQVSKREIPLPNGKKAYLVDYNEFIKVAEDVTQKKVSEYVRDVNNFKKVVQQDREELKRKRENFNREQALKEAREISKLVFQDTFYRKSLLISKGFKSAYYAGTIAKAAVPEYQKIVSPKSSKAFFSNPADFILDEKFVDFLSKEEQKRWIKHSKIKKPVFCFENFSIPFLRRMGLDTEEKEILKETKPKVVKIKKVRKEKELGKIGQAFLDFLQLSFDDEEEFESDEVLETVIDKPSEEKANKKIVSIEEKSKSYKSKKHRDKDIKYQVYLLCQKLSNKKINDFSSNEKMAMIRASKNYINKLKKGEDHLFDYEKEYALLVANQIYNYLNSFPLSFDKKVFDYMNSYMENMKDYFEIAPKHKVIDFKISKETRKKIIKNISKVASLALVFVVGLGAKGMTSENEEKEMIGIEHDFSESNTENYVSKMKVEKPRSSIENVNQSIQMQTLTNENKIEVNFLTNQQMSEQQEYYSIDEAIQVNEGSNVYGTLSDLAKNTNDLKPYYDSKDINRTVRSVVVENDEQKIQKLYSNEDVDHYLSLDYDVIGYEIVNQYSFNLNGDYVGSEGYYVTQNLSRKLVK